MHTAVCVCVMWQKCQLFVYAAGEGHQLEELQVTMWAVGPLRGGVQAADAHVYARMCVCLTLIWTFLFQSPLLISEQRGGCVTPVQGDGLLGFSPSILLKDHSSRPHFRSPLIRLRALRPSSPLSSIFIAINPGRGKSRLLPSWRPDPCFPPSVFAHLSTCLNINRHGSITPENHWFSFVAFRNPLERREQTVPKEQCVRLITASSTNTPATHEGCFFCFFLRRLTGQLEHLICMRLLHCHFSTNRDHCVSDYVFIGLWLCFASKPKCFCSFFLIIILYNGEKANDIKECIGATATKVRKKALLFGMKTIYF